MKPRKNGRPTKMTNERQAEIVKYVSLGLSRERATALAGIHRATFYAFQQHFPDFHDRVEQAEAKCQARCLSVINRAGMPKVYNKSRTKTRTIPVEMKGKPGKFVTKQDIVEQLQERVEKQEGDWQASAWLLERRWPQEYGRVDRHLLRVKSDVNVPLSNDFIQAVNLALGVTGKLIPIGAPALLGEGENGDREIDLEVLPD